MKTATKQAGLVFTSRMLGYVLGFLLQTVLARFLGPDKYGLYSLGLTLANVGVLFSVFGMGTGTIRFLGEYIGKNEKEKAKGVIFSAFQLTTLLSLVFAVMLTAFKNFISINIFHDERLSSILPWFSVVLVMYSFLQLFSGIYRGLKRPSIFFLCRETLERIMRIGIFLTLYLLGFKLFGAIVATIISAIFILLILFIKLKSTAPFVFDKSITPLYERKKFLGYSSNMLFVSFTYFLMGQVNRLILGIYLDAKSVGMYTISDTVAQLSVFFLTAFNSIFAAIISELYHTGDRKTLAKMYADITRWIVILTLPLTIWMIVFSEQILSIFGKEYTQAKYVLIFLAMGQFVNAAVGSNGFMLLMTKHQKLEMINGVLIASLNILLNIILVPKLGIIGSAIAGMIAISGVNILKMVEVYLTLGMIPYNTKYIKPIISGSLLLLLAGITHKFVSNIPITLCMLPLLFAVMIGLLIALRLYEEDKEIMGVIMRKMKFFG